jgi:DNA-directed RNA polymerase specialized sigma24 family protein
VDSKARTLFKEQLPRVYRQVLARAVMLVQRHPRYAQGYDSPGKAAEELAQEAVVRVLAGCRTWDPAKVEITFFLKEVMRSIVDADLKSPASAKDSLDAPEINRSEATTSSADQQLAVLDDRDRGLAKGAEQQLLERERCAAIVDRALEAAGTDAVLVKLVEAIAEGCGKPAETAQATGLSVDQVYEATRKLRRRLSARGSRP